jgi:hypothetical protein
MSNAAVMLASALLNARRLHVRLVMTPSPGVCLCCVCFRRDLKYNQLTAAIPDWLGSLASLQLLCVAL